MTKLLVVCRTAASSGVCAMTDNRC